MSELNLLDTWKLSPAQARVLLKIHDARDGCAVETLSQIGARHGAASSESRVHVVVHHLRKKLEPHGVEIISVRGKYALTEASSRLVTAVLRSNPIARSACA